MSETVGQAVERVERVSDMLAAQAPEFARAGFCLPCLEGNHADCAAMTHLPETGHLCECPWLPWSAERKDYR
jgi:hypothetical protein